MKKVAIDDLAQEVMVGLQEYADLASGAMKKAVQRSGRRVRKEIKANAPKDEGDYQKSWSVRKENETASQLHLIVYSKNRYQLAHLLEHGHVTRNGKRRVKGPPHILPAEEVGAKQLQEDIERALRGG